MGCNNSVEASGPKAEAAPAEKIKIYGLPASQNVCGPVIFGMELKVGAFEFLDLMNGAHKQPEYLGKIPSGKVPGMEDGNVKIGESCAILRYLAMKYGPKYYPIDKPAVCYKIDFALDAFCNQVYEAHTKVVYPALGFNSPPEDQAAANKDYGEKIAKWFQDHVAGKFVLGDTLSIADFKVLPFFFAASQPAVKAIVGFTAAARVTKYCEDVTAAVGASEFLKSAGGYSITEYAASKMPSSPVEASPAVEIDGNSKRTVGTPAGDKKVKIHGAPPSMNCVGPALLAQESGCGAFEPVNFMEGAHKKPEFLAINPQGQMPALEDGTVTGGESLAILRYLAMKYAPKYYPVANKEATARIDYAMEDFQSRVYEAHKGCVYPVCGFTAMPTDIPAASKAYVEAMENWASAHLKGKFVLGDEVSIADFKVVPFFFCALQPGLQKKMGLEPPAKITEYCNAFVAAVGASSFMKEAGGFSIAELIASKTQ